MVIFISYLGAAYLTIAVLFLVGFTLRILHKYPGKDEPLILDFSALVIALIYAFLARLIGLSILGDWLIFTSSLIILPHIIYILGNDSI